MSWKSNLSKSIKEYWDYDSNSGLDPDGVLSASQKVWWKCDVATDHKWFQSLKDRGASSGCPFCANRRISVTNSFAKKHPNLLAEWHPTKNGDLDPNTLVEGSGKRVWWKCSRDSTHEWTARISNRTTRGTGCPKCKGSTSLPELRLYAELNSVFEDITNRDQSLGKELDIYLPQLKVGVEYDGSYYHNGKEKNDKSKNKHFDAHGIKIIRLRAKPLKKISSIDILVEKDSIEKKDIDKLLLRLLNFRKIDSESSVRIAEYLSQKNFVNDSEYKKYQSYLPGPIPGNSLADSHFHLASEWHYEMNNPLTPYHFSSGSNHNAWWQCSEHKTHKYQAMIKDRVRGNSCPYCASKRVWEKNSLAYLYPKIAEEWHPSLNGDITPNDVVAGSSKKFWFICPKGHEYNSVLSNRAARKSCPYCANKKVGQGNSLAETHPELALEWHPSLNGDITPNDVVAGSSKKFWWKCKVDNNHSWQATLTNRSRGRKCPHCSNKIVSTNNNFQNDHPELSKFWHPTKNNGLLPSEIVSGSARNIWWKCSQGEDHEWERSLRDQITSNGCPYCEKRLPSKSFNLAINNPSIAREWNYEMNGDITPEKIIPGSTFFAWWKCPKAEDHIWKAQVYKRAIYARGCPCCSNKKVVKSNSLRTINPELAKEWNYIKNQKTPDDVTAVTTMKVWWICSNNNKHEWEATVRNRNEGKYRCPLCYPTKLKKFD